MPYLLYIGLIVLIIFIILWFRRDREYMKKDLSETLSEEVRRDLNFRMDDNHKFMNTLDQTKGKVRPSRFVAIELDEEDTAS